MLRMLRIKRPPENGRENVVCLRIHLRKKGLTTRKCYSNFPTPCSRGITSALFLLCTCNRLDIPEDRWIDIFGDIFQDNRAIDLCAKAKAFQRRSICKHTARTGTNFANREYKRFAVGDGQWQASVDCLNECKALFAGERNAIYQSTATKDGRQFLDDGFCFTINK